MSAESLSLLPAPSRKYGPRARSLFARAAAERVPLAGSIELTHRCNLACLHCYVNLPAADRAAQRREMTLAQIETILDELAALGTLSLTLTGGEPLLRPDFRDIYRAAHQRGFVVTVYSNATLITDAILELFRAYPPAAVDVTMYGYSAETYDRVADAGAGQHARYRRGVERLLEAGLRVSLKTVAMKSNAHEVPRMAELAEALGCDFRLDAVISPRIDGGRKPLAERLSPSEVAAVEMATPEAKLDLEEFCQSYVGAAPSTDALYQCGAGLGNFLIDPYGRLHVCELSRTLGWDVVAHGFARGWYQGVPEVRAKKRAHDEGCGSCHAHGVCSNCVGMAELERLGPEDGNLYFCEITDARNQRVFGDQRPRPNGLVRLRLPTKILAAS